MLRHLTSLALGTAFAVTATTAFAANCAPRDIVVERLASNYTEHLAARGLQEAADKTMVLEIWASEDTGTFTVLMTNAHGITCVMAAGTHWFPEPRAKLSGVAKGTPS